MNKVKVKINKCANNIMWVEAWVKQAHPSVVFEIGAEPIEDKWVCEFSIPTVNKTVKSISSTEVNAMLNSAKKARKLIEDYMMEHPECKITIDEHWSKNWEIKEDDEGHFVSLGRSGLVREKEGIVFIKRMAAVRRAFEVALMKASKLLGSTEGLNVQILDKRLFSDDADVREIEDQIWERYETEQGADNFSPSWATAIRTDDNLIFIRYQEEKNRKEDAN